MNSQNLNTAPIKKLLNQSTALINHHDLEQLHYARDKALTQHRVLHNAPVLAWLCHHGITLGTNFSKHKQLDRALVLLFIIALFSGVTYWQQINEHEHDHSEIDIAILTDDLPMDVYVD
jgi:hypothetical protein